MRHITPTQHTILEAATQRPDGNIEPLPSHINSGIRPRVIEALLQRKLITQQDDTFVINDAGREAIGDVPSTPPTAPSTPKPLRPGSKQAIMVELLQRPEGATIEALCQATGWQAHTVRGTFSNVIKKRLQRTLLSRKENGEDRTYYLPATDNDSEDNDTPETTQEKRESREESLDNSAE